MTDGYGADVTRTSSGDLPVLFFDGPFAPEFHDLVAGRAVVVGPERSDLVDADAVIAGMYRWDAEAMAEGPKLRVISRIGVGYDTVDVDGATAAGITVCYAPEAPTVSTAEHAVALMMAITKTLPSSHERSRAGVAGGPATATELDGLVLGLLGFGRIARRVAAVGSALGMRVITHDPFATDTDGAEHVDADDLWRLSDVVSLHAPATDATRHVVNARSIALMKPGAFLVNCARGGLVDHDALLAALNSGHLAAAGLDVTEPEPLPIDHPLLAHPNVIVSAHVASSTTAGRRRLYRHAIDHALATLAGTPTSVVAEQC